MSDELGRIWKEVVIAYFKAFPSIHLERLRITTTNLSQDSQCPGKDTNWAPPTHQLETSPSESSSSLHSLR
jgi:hypothetical protein